MSLPFADRSFSVAASVDAIEHLPGAELTMALSELIRVAKKAVVNSFPDGVRARRVDASFYEALSESHMPVPEWLTNIWKMTTPTPNRWFPLL